MANASFTQANRPLRVTTPLGPDVPLLTGFSARESISELFHFQLDMQAENKKDVAFDKLLGQKVTVEIVFLGSKKVFFNGIVSRFSQGQRDELFTSYRAEVVPQLWMLTRNWQSRIFQHLAVPDILKQVLAGLDVSFDLQGTFEPRDYCAQYRETDFNFASRLMEEEGIYYFFKHSASGHQMVIANSPQSHPDVPHQNKVIYDELGGGARDDLRITGWAKVQELRSGKYTLYDHCFELPHKHLEADRTILESVQAGTVTHKLKVGGNDKLEVYDFPGEYAQRFDGVDKGGGEQPAELQKIFQDNKRTVAIRMEQEAVPGLAISGVSNCGQFVSGHKFTLDRHFNGDGPYLLTSVMHAARGDDFRSGGGDFIYSNNFTCIPFALPFRPQRVSPRPVVQGTQTAVVVGPSGEEIFTDKYGRVKVQFHWERNGKNNADSSCWVRVVQPWAGKRWGIIHIPRIGQEVVVDFLEGDPDQPLVVGSVYNADQMPPYDLPKEKTKSTLKSRSTLRGTASNFNEIRFEDKKDSEQIFINAEKDMDLRVENDEREWVGEDRHLIVKRHQQEMVEKDKHLHVKGDQLESIDGKMSLTVGGDRHEKIGQVDTSEAGQEIHLKAGMKVIIEAGTQISLVVGGNFIDISPAGISIVGTMVMINSGGAAGTGTPAQPAGPKDPDVADDGTKTGKMN